MSSTTDVSVPKYLDQYFFEKVLREYTKCADLSIEKFKIGLGCENGENFCSIVYRVQIYFTNANKRSEEVTWIVKSMPYEAERAVLKDMLLYKKETDMYFDILPEMEKLIGRQLAPRCYYATSNPIDTIVFQDLTPLGFKQVDKANALDEQHCAVVLRRLGKFHAASLSLVEENPKCFDNFHVGLFARKYFEPQQMNDFYMSTYNTIRKLVGQWPGYEEIEKKLANIEKHYLKKVAEVYESENYSFRVLNHGDLWTNNLFFKYDVYGPNKPSDCIFIDFQGCIFTSPGIDLNYFLNMSVQLSVLQHKRQHILKEYYYEPFRQKCFQLSVSRVPSFEVIENEIRNKEFFGLFAAIGSALLSTDRDTLSEISLENIVDKDMSDKLTTLACSTEKFQTKMQYILRRANDLGILD